MNLERFTPALRRLRDSKARDRRALLSSCPTAFLRVLSDIAHNVLQGTLDAQGLRPFTDLLRQIRRKGIKVSLLRQLLMDATAKFYRLLLEFLGDGEILGDSSG